jgi:hypothetical protein
MTDADTLMRQAHMTAHDYMLNARVDIDSIFGAGYAKAHPELVAAYMQTAVRDFHTTFTVHSQQTLVHAIDRIADALTGKNNSGVGYALEEIAGALSKE